MLRWTILLCPIVAAACGPEVSARDVPVPQTPAAPSDNAGDSDSARIPAADPAPLLDAPAPLLDVLAPGAASELLPVVLFSDLDADVGARMDGVIRTVSAELGDVVQQGQVLAVLDDEREVARVAAQAAAVELARTEYTRAEGLHASGFVTAAQFEEARFRLLSAEATLRVAQVDLEHTRVTAPFGGVVTRRMTGRGRTVRDGDALFRVTALQPLRATARLPELRARGVRVGERALIRADGGLVVEAQVVRVSPAVDPASGTVEVLFAVPRPGALRPGSGALLELTNTAGAR